MRLVPDAATLAENIFVLAFNKGTFALKRASAIELINFVESSDDVVSSTALPLCVIVAPLTVVPALIVVLDDSALPVIVPLAVIAPVAGGDAFTPTD
jgi:hypothetical protein